MARELTAKELAAVYEGTLVNVEEEDSYGITFSLRKAEIEYREDFSELVFDGEGYEIRFSFFNDSPIESISYSKGRKLSE
ncbi:MAG: hypothetical protein LUI14_05885 [Lachnospiraceae bacterium]|nr:hypothetical protein [Lachnospiraceae bacterium]